MKSIAVLIDETMNLEHILVVSKQQSGPVMRPIRLEGNMLLCERRDGLNRHELWFSLDEIYACVPMERLTPNWDRSLVDGERCEKKET